MNDLNFHLKNWKKKKKSNLKQKKEGEITKIRAEINETEKQ